MWGQNNIIKSGKNIMYTFTFTIMVHRANVYIIFLPDFILTVHMVRWIGLVLMTPKSYDNHRQMHREKSAKRTEYQQRT